MADRDRLLQMLEGMLRQLKDGSTTQVETMHIKCIIKPTDKNIDNLAKGIAMFLNDKMTFNAVIVMIVAGGC